MRIISQSGKSIDFELSEISVVDDAIVYQSVISKGVLGLYKSTERAFEVLEDIHNTWEEEYSFKVYTLPEE